MASLFGMERREVIRIKVKVRKRQRYKAKLKFKLFSPKMTVDLD